ncbi:MAG TPA: prepilin-type N-terminal cleavage/methylation domain-containing protein [Verrucomicrobiae bacterium]|nr:prepilin-type N-terminal cleavage/methylation domain-containing protein [Verrucomicrobiae bacterium]
MKILRPKIQAAFTLVELLVVTATAGILAALLLPAISQSKKRAQQIQCVGNLHQLGVGLQIFLANNHGYPTAAQNTNDENPGLWQTQLEHGGLGIEHPSTNFLNTGIWLCPSLKSDTFTSYGYNEFGNIAVGNFTNNFGLSGSEENGKYVPITESEVIAPNGMMAIGDSLIGSIFFERLDLSYLDRNGFATSRHQGKANVVFCDGHVESPTLPFLFTDTSDAALSRWNRDHLPHRERLSP